MVTFNVLFLGLLPLLLYYMWTKRQFYYIFWRIGGPIGYPLLGVAHKLVKREKFLNYFSESEKTYGRVFMSWLGPAPFLVVAEPKVAQLILTSPDCVNKAVIYAALTDALGTGLITSNNPDWKNHRKLLNPTFSHKVLLSFFPIFNREANNLQVELNELVGSGEVDIRYILQKRTLIIASQTTMGQMTHADQYKDILNCVKGVLKTIVKVAAAPWLRFEILMKMTDFYQSYVESKNKIRSFVRIQIKEKLSKAENQLQKDNFFDTNDEFETTKSSKIFIDRAIDLFEKGEFTWQDVENESVQIVLGAFETTANTIGYTLILLSMFPKYQDKLFEEIKSIIPSMESNIDLTNEDIKQMTYLDMVLNETMRIMAPVPLIGREITNDVTLSDGVVLPKGMQVIIDIFNMHRDPEYWGPDSTTFNPDNFLPINMKDKHPYTFIPFAKGIRHCIGWRYGLISLKIILSKILRKYSFTTKFDFRDFEFVEDITIKLSKHPLLEIHLRES